MSRGLTNTHPALRLFRHPVALLTDLTDGTPLGVTLLGERWLSAGPFLDPINDTFVAGPFTTQMSAGVLADNSLDSAHFPVLHAGTFGAEDDVRPTLTAPVPA